MSGNRKRFGVGRTVIIFLFLAVVGNLSAKASEAKDFFTTNQAKDAAKKFVIQAIQDKGATVSGSPTFRFVNEYIIEDHTGAGFGEVYAFVGFIEAPGIPGKLKGFNVRVARPGNTGQWLLEYLQFTMSNEPSWSRY